MGQRSGEMYGVRFSDSTPEGTQKTGSTLTLAPMPGRQITPGLPLYRELAVEGAKKHVPGMILASYSMHPSTPTPSIGDQCIYMYIILYARGIHSMAWRMKQGIVDPSSCAGYTVLYSPAVRFAQPVTPGPQPANGMAAELRTCDTTMTYIPYHDIFEM